MLAYSGKSPFIAQTFDRDLRLFGTRDASAPFYPQPMGNMVVGEVLRAGANIDHVRPGQTVFAWAPLCDVHVLPARSVQPLGDLTHEQALLIHPASFALGGVIAGALEPSRSVLVTGSAQSASLLCNIARTGAPIHWQLRALKVGEN
jgi:NADPH:quinone reductase-like Zn-dependent oxidoreductase